MNGWPRWILGAFLLLGVNGCESPVAECDICTLTARVQGDVSTESGSPVVGAEVTLHALYGLTEAPCGTYDGFADPPSVDSTDADGRFDMDVGGVSIGGPICVEVRVEPPLGLEAPPVADSVPAEFVLPGERPEVARVDLIMMPTGS
jgi:hypothetical protein